MNNVLEHFEVFPWHEHFNTAIEAIDRQHQQLAARLNHLACTLTEHPDMAEPFHQLSEYARIHFEEEERLWAKYFSDEADEDWLLSHQHSHTAFVTELQALTKTSRLKMPWRTSSTS